MRLTWTLVAALLILSLLRLSLHIAGSLIHLMLAFAFVLLLVDMLRGRRAA